MKIITREETADFLKLELRPNGVILFLAGLLFVGAGIFTIRVLGHHSVVAVESGVLRYEKRSLGLRGVRGFTFPADEIAGISVELQDHGHSFEIVVEAGGRSSPIPLVSVGGDDKRAIAAKLGEALSVEAGAYVYEEDGRVGALVVGGACLVGGLICWFVMQVVTISADRARGILVIHRRGRFLPRGKKRELRLEAIRGVRVKAETMNTMKQRVISYQVFIDLGSESVPVAMGPMFTDHSAEELRGRLVTWLDGT